MARKICRYTLKVQEQKLWLKEDMDGWKRAMEACVEDDARDQGSKKYIIYDRKGEILARNEVRPLPHLENEPEHAEL